MSEDAEAESIMAKWDPWFADVADLRRTVAAVRGLHKPIPGFLMSDGSRPPRCDGHGDNGGFWTEWPCPTARLVYTPAEIGQPVGQPGDEGARVYRYNDNGDEHPRREGEW